MKADPIVFKETPEQAAESISAALDFLGAEAESSGLTDVSELIRRASAKAKERSAQMSSIASTEYATDLLEVCKAIVALPAEYRNALVFKKVYRRSYAEIADDCRVSVDIAKARVLKGFQLVRGSLYANPVC